VTDNNPSDSARYKSIKALYAGPLQRSRTHPNVSWDNWTELFTESEGLTVGVMKELKNVAERKL
jgi:hypothetical protein